MLGHFLITPLLKKRLEFQSWRKAIKLSMKNSISNYILHQWLKFTRWTVSIRKKNNQKVVNFALASDWSRMVKDAQLFSNYLKGTVWNIKQYPNHIMMIMKQNILAIQRKFSNLQKKKIIKNFIRRQFPTLLLLNFLKVH